MSSKPKAVTCPECAMQFNYDCEREIVCPGCGQWQNYGNDCECSSCRADATAQAAVQRIATAVQLPVSTVHAVIETLAASSS